MRCECAFVKHCVIYILKSTNFSPFPRNSVWKFTIYLYSIKSSTFNACSFSGNVYPKLNIILPIVNGINWKNFSTHALPEVLTALVVTVSCLKVIRITDMWPINHGDWNNIMKLKYGLTHQPKPHLSSIHWCLMTSSFMRIQQIGEMKKW